MILRNSVFILLFISNHLSSQRPVIDINAIEKWPSLSHPMISNNGKYFSCIVNNMPKGTSTILVRSIIGDWKMEVVGGSVPTFTEDSRNIIYMNSNDSICIKELGSTASFYIPAIKSFELFKFLNSEWLIYQPKYGNDLVIRNCKTNKSLHFKHVSDYRLSNSSGYMFFKEELGDGRNILRRVDIANGESTIIYEGDKIGNIVLDKHHNQLAFLVISGEDDKVKKSIWFCEDRSLKAIQILTEKDTDFDKNLTLLNITSFSRDGQMIFIKMKENGHVQVKSGVDLWSYTDIKIQSQQLNELTSESSKSFKAIVDIKRKKYLPLHGTNESLVFLENQQNELGIITSSDGLDYADGYLGLEWYWNKKIFPKFYSVSLQTGQRTQLPINFPKYLSPSGRFLIGSEDSVEHMINNYVSYDIQTGKVCNITRLISIPNDMELFSSKTLKHKFEGVAAYVIGKEKVLIYDQYDIWKVDLAGITAPVNLTKGYGRKNNITFRIQGSFDFYDKGINENEEVMLSAFDHNTKNAGFFKMSMQARWIPQRLFIDSAKYDDWVFSFPKARDAEVYLVERQTATQSPNYFYTTDFKKVRSINRCASRKRVQLDEN